MLVRTNADKFKEKGDSLIIFTHWFLLKYNFDLIENHKVTMCSFFCFNKFYPFFEKVDNQFNFNKRRSDGGISLTYSINEKNGCNNSSK
jgi:hypothetical protein